MGKRLTSFVFPSLSRFCHSSASINYTEHKLKNKMGEAWEQRYNILVTFLLCLLSSVSGVG